MTYVSVTPGRYAGGTFDPSRYQGLQEAPPQGTVIEIREDGLVLDLSGVTLDGEGTGGVGIRGPRLRRRDHCQRRAHRLSLRHSCRQRQQPEHKGLRRVGQHQPPGGRLALRYRGSGGGRIRRGDISIQGPALCNREQSTQQQFQRCQPGPVGSQRSPGEPRFLLRQCGDLPSQVQPQRGAQQPGRALHPLHRPFLVRHRRLGGDSPGGRLQPQPDSWQQPALQRRRVLHPGPQSGTVQPQLHIRQ